MNLVIDLGNTLVKCAVFEDSTMVDFFVFKEFDKASASSILAKFKGIRSVILSSVINQSEEVAGFFKHLNFYCFDRNSPLPLKNLYQSPESLGYDRIAGAVAGNNRFPDQNVLIIDAGTCLKFDFVNKDNAYLGGAISPGMNMRYKALHTFTAKLPLISYSEKVEVMGTTTQESITSGVQQGMLEEIKGRITSLREKYNDLQIVATGGDWIYFDKEFKNSIFADPYLVLKGLNIILNYNLAGRD
jgi:type III pantothenate kinase